MLRNKNISMIFKDTLGITRPVTKFNAIKKYKKCKH